VISKGHNVASVKTAMRFLVLYIWECLGRCCVWSLDCAVYFHFISPNRGSKKAQNTFMFWL